MKSRIILTIGLIVAVQCGSTFGTSRLIFPRFSNESKTLTGLAIVNPGTQVAGATLSAYAGDGSLLSGQDFQNPVSVSIPAGGQYSAILETIFGAGLEPGTIGWIDARSEAGDLTGFFLYLNFPDFGFFDGADLPEPSRNIIFSDIRTTEGFSTELNIVNPGDDTTDVVLRLVGQDSALRTLPVPGRGVVRLDAGELLGSQAAGASPAMNIAIEVESGLPVAGFEFVRGSGDLLGLNALPANEQTSNLVFPQMTVGGGTGSELVLTSSSRSSTLVTLTAHREDGILFGPEDLNENPASVVLPAQETLRLNLETVFGFRDGTLREGWLEVAGSQASLQGSLSYSIPALGSLAGVAGTGVGTRQAVFSHIATDQGFFTGIAVLNSGALAATVRVAAVNVAGILLGTTTFTLPPGRRVADLLGSELVPGAAGQSGGLVWVSSDVPIHLTSLFGRTGGSGVLANIPPQQVPPEFDPARTVPVPRVEPSLSALSPGAQQGFSFLLGSEMGMPSWEVNGVPGGNDEVGTVSGEGVYQAPATVPSNLPVVVTATANQQSASASVDILQRQILVSELGFIQSVAYLEGAQRLYVSEIRGFALGVTPRSPGQVSRSRILDVTEEPTQVRQIFSENIVKMLGFQASDGTEYLLMAGSQEGIIYRLQPQQSELEEIVTGLDRPQSMAFDAFTGDLLVAEADRISLISRSRLEALPGSGGDSADVTQPFGLTGSFTPTGLASDRCTGDLYVSDGGSGQVLRFDRLTGIAEALAEGLADPTHLLPLYRANVSCPESLEVLVVESGAGRVRRIVPRTGLVQTWVESPGVRDIALVPADNPLSEGASIVAAESSGSSGQVADISVAGLYGTQATGALEPILAVTNTNDSGPGSLRQVLTDLPGLSFPLPIGFRIPVSDPGFDPETGVFTIRLSSQLPQVRNNTTVDGTTQTRFTGDTNPLGPEIQLTGPGGGAAFAISGDNNTIRGLVLNNFGVGVTMSFFPDRTPSNNRISENYIGTDPTGTMARPNTGFAVGIQGFACEELEADNNKVEHNILAASGQEAIVLCGTERTTVRRNRIGTGRTGTENLGNAGHGVNLVCACASLTTIHDNLIVNNGGHGVISVPDFRFPVATTPDGHFANELRRNSIYANGDTGIRLLPENPTGVVLENDDCDADVGANGLQNYPVLAVARQTSNTLVVGGQLNSTPGSTFLLEFFSSQEGDPSGFGEGQSYLGSLMLTTSDGCTQSFEIEIAAMVPVGYVITATATDVSGNTSEFSNGVMVQ